MEQELELLLGTGVGREALSVGSGVGGVASVGTLVGGFDGKAVWSCHTDQWTVGGGIGGLEFQLLLVGLLWICCQHICRHFSWFFN